MYLMATSLFVNRILFHRPDGDDYNDILPEDLDEDHVIVTEPTANYDSTASSSSPQKPSTEDSKPVLALVSTELHP